MKRLWEKGLPLDALVHRFTVGDDPVVDLALVEYDAIGSAAHARGLNHAGLLTGDALTALLGALAGIATDARAGTFRITPEQEDCHTAIEQRLTAETGDAGKRIHLGRSRNDQVQTALRLWQRDQLFILVDAVADLADALLAFADAHRDVRWPGYTHLRRAMPSSAAQWASGFAEGLVEEVVAASRSAPRRGSACPCRSRVSTRRRCSVFRAYSARRSTCRTRGAVTSSR
jgi:argininosuccinate lyase